MKLEMKTILVTQCCVCDKVKVDGVYKEVESDYIDKIEGYVILSHGYCPDCRAEVYKEIDEMYKEVQNSKS